MPCSRRTPWGSGENATKGTTGWKDSSNSGLCRDGCTVRMPAPFQLNTVTSISRHCLSTESPAGDVPTFCSMSVSKQIPSIRTPPRRPLFVHLQIDVFPRARPRRQRGNQIQDISRNGLRRAHRPNDHLNPTQYAGQSFLQFNVLGPGHPPCNCHSFFYGLAPGPSRSWPFVIIETMSTSRHAMNRRRLATWQYAL